MTKIQNQSGQAMIEFLLVGIIALLIWGGITKSLQKSGTLQSVFGDPWVRLANLIEMGVPTSKPAPATIHPASPERHSTRLSQ